MHAAQVDISLRDVRTALDSQFPEFQALPLTPFASSGTVNAVFRLGDHLVVRVPLIDWGASDARREALVLGLLANRPSVAIPEFIGHGRAVPHAGIPWDWSVLRWIEGDRSHGDRVADPDGLAASLATVFSALSRVPTCGAPRALASGEIDDDHEQIRAVIGSIGHLVDAAGVVEAWDSMRGIPRGAAADLTWIHGDPTPGNLIVEGGRLTALIDWASAGVGDVSHDLIVAWWLLPASSRRRFRDTVACDDATWARGRARALRKAIPAVAYYADSNPDFSADARFAIGQVLADLD